MAAASFIAGASRSGRQTGVAGRLTTESKIEQASAQLDHCTVGEFEEFQALNERYKNIYNSHIYWLSEVEIDKRSWKTFEVGWGTTPKSNLQRR